MKRFLLGTIMLFIVTSSIAHVEAFTTEEQNIVDRVVTRRHARQPASVLESRTQKILDRINDLQMRARLTVEAAEILNYVEIRLTNIINALQGKALIPTTANTTTTIYPDVTSSTFPSKLTTPQRLDNNSLIIAGTTSPLFQEIRYSVSTEPMVITNVTLQTSRDNIQDRVQEFALYDENGNFIASTISNGRLVNFNYLNLRREPWTYRFYVALHARSIDDMYTSSAINFSLSLQTISAEWVYSQKTISPNIQSSNTSTAVTISPVWIDTVQFIDTRNGYQTDTYLSNWENTLGILELTTPNVQSRYQQDLILDTIKIEVYDNTSARQLAYNLRMYRLDDQSNNAIAWTVQGSTVTFSLWSAWMSNLIQQGQSAIFRFTANLSLDNNVGESVQLTIRDLKNGWITYHHLQWTNETITTVQQRNWEIFGQRVSD